MRYRALLLGVLALGALTVTSIARALAESLPGIPCYTLQEPPISVPVDLSTVTSTTVLASGVSYKIRASGTFFIGGPGDGLADAEYFDFTNPTDECCGMDIGLAINMPTSPTPDKFPFWGDYNPSHVYTIDFVGQGAPISLSYRDGDRNNTGFLTVEVFAPGETAGSAAISIQPASRTVAPNGSTTLDLQA